MSYYRTCPDCGAHLDPGECCADCKEKTPAGAANTGEGRAEQTVTTVSDSIIQCHEQERKGDFIMKTDAEIADMTTEELRAWARELVMQLTDDKCRDILDELGYMWISGKGVMKRSDSLLS